MLNIKGSYRLDQRVQRNFFEDGLSELFMGFGYY